MVTLLSVVLDIEKVVSSFSFLQSWRKKRNFIRKSVLLHF